MGTSSLLACHAGKWAELACENECSRDSCLLPMMAVGDVCQEALEEKYGRCLSSTSVSRCVQGKWISCSVQGTPNGCEEYLGPNGWALAWSGPSSCL